MDIALAGKSASARCLYTANLYWEGTHAVILDGIAPLLPGCELPLSFRQKFRVEHATLAKLWTAVSLREKHLVALPDDHPFAGGYGPFRWIAPDHRLARVLSGPSSRRQVRLVLSVDPPHALQEILLAEITSEVGLHGVARADDIFQLVEPSVLVGLKELMRPGVELSTHAIYPYSTVVAARRNTPLQGKYFLGALRLSPLSESLDVPAQQIFLPVREVGAYDENLRARLVVMEQELREAFLGLLGRPDDGPGRPPEVEVRAFRVHENYLHLPASQAAYEQKLQSLSVESLYAEVFPLDTALTVPLYVRSGWVVLSHGYLFPVEPQKFTLSEIIRLGGFVHPDRVSECARLLRQ